MNVLILGLGQYPKGSGVAAALHFAKAGDQVIATDLKTEAQLADNVKQLSRFKNVRFKLGKHDPKDIAWAHLIVRGPSVRDSSKEMKLARKLGKSVTSDLALFLEACPCLVIGITGTRGKSTTTAMIHEVLSASKKWRKVWLGGNILISPLTFLAQVKSKDLVVLEMSSFQLEGTGDAGISPHIAVWTNLMCDHLNMYPSMAEYAEAKAQIFRHQDADDVVFFPADKSFNVYTKEAPSEVVRVKKSSIVLSIPGEHNQMNASFAAAVAKELGVSASKIKSALKAFKGLPNRIETIATKGGLTFVNDTTATTPDGTIAALNSYPAKNDRLIHLIFGGADKELDFTEVTKLLKKRKDVGVYLLAGTAHKKIEIQFKKSGIHYADFENFDAVFSKLKEMTEKGDIVLLSPGCASFGLFKNEFHRGEEFVKLVKKWK
ncbi:UDP-N-acetylmuramoyl-L-alanine--D-glutamate ligase [Candidatus Uhrbacteria bacterium]|nr:UDP-N-acetylmuramoyl-L-alanine--D-glutamate ligase [Candidatus Uhrbacteria bacterium]